jgi:hypothetical protein
VALCCAAGAPAQERERQTYLGAGYVIYYSPRQADQIPQVAAAAARSINRLEDTLELSLRDRVEIYVARDQADFSQLTGGHGGPNILGMAFPRRRRLVLRPLTGEAGDQLIAHELAHILLEDKLEDIGGEAPRWLHEGVAQYAAESYGPAERVRLIRAVNRDEVIPLGDLAQAFDSAEPEEVALAYAEAYSLVDYLDLLARGEGLVPFLTQLALVGEVDRALLRTYGLSTQEFERGWQEHILREYRGKWVEDLMTVAIWAGIACLFLVVLWVRLRRSAQIRARLEQEEQARAALALWSHKKE